MKGAQGVVPKAASALIERDEAGRMPAEAVSLTCEQLRVRVPTSSLATTLQAELRQAAGLR